MKYRAEIDGLRALAVLPVILFHAGFEWFSGGFIGVDVFFVISGYLITSMIIAEMNEGNFSIVNFYERRARRILPALFFVMFLCLPFAWLWLTPNYLKDFGQSLVAVSTFSSNILFWLEDGYFDPVSELKPLLHTWSLAIEEQYYILFPIFLILTWRFGIKWILILLSLIFLVSLSITQWGSDNAPSAAFYLLPTRGWELLIGVFSAFYLHYNAHLKSHTTNQLLSTLGFSMIVYSIIVFNETTPFPSLYTLIPTLGTGLLILFAVPKTLIHHILSLKPIVGVGLISYSAYLWHQPLLAFTRHRVFGEVSDLLLILLCIASIVMAWISWRFIEIPFRDKARVKSNNIFLFSITGILFFAFVGFLTQSDVIRTHSPTNLQNMKYHSFSEKLETVGEVCKAEEIKKEELYSYCVIGSKQADRSIILYGDSHLRSMQYVLNQRLQKEGIKGVWIRNIEASGMGCESTIFTTLRRNEGKRGLLDCPNSFSSMLDHFSEADYLILSSRWSMRYFYPNSHLDSPFFENKALGCAELETYRSYVPYDESSFKKPSNTTMTEALTNLLELSASKINTIVIYPVPEVGCDPYRYSLNYKRNTGLELVSMSFPVNEYDERNKFVINILDDFAERNKKSFIPIRLKPIFCSRTEEKNCVVIENSIPFYLDDDHLSDAGSDIIVDEVVMEIQ